MPKSKMCPRICTRPFLLNHLARIPTATVTAGCATAVKLDVSVFVVVEMALSPAVAVLAFAAIVDTVTAVIPLVVPVVVVDAVVS